MRTTLKILALTGYVALGTFTAIQFKEIALMQLLICAIVGISGGFLAYFLFDVLQ